MVFEEDGDQEFEYNAYFAGPCACPPNCPNHAANPYCEDESCNVDHEDDYDARGRHSWGSCDEELPDETICPCDAGWEE